MSIKSTTQDHGSVAEYLTGLIGKNQFNSSLTMVFADPKNKNIHLVYENTQAECEDFLQDFIYKITRIESIPYHLEEDKKNKIRANSALVEINNGLITAKPSVLDSRSLTVRSTDGDMNTLSVEKNISAEEVVNDKVHLDDDLVYEDN